MLPDPQRRAFESNVWKSYLYGFLTDLPLTAPIWVLYLRDARGFSLTQIAWLEVPLFLLITFAEVPTGAVADRFGRKVSLLIGSALLAVAIAVYGIASSYLLILVSNLAWGLAFTFRSGADTALLYDSLARVGREGEFQRINGRFWALRSTALLTALLLGAPIAAATSYTFAIMLGALLNACAIPVALAMREPREPHAHVREPYLWTLAAGVREASARPLLRWLFLFSGILTPCGVAPLLLFQQPWLAAHHVDTAELGLWQAPVQAAQILSALAAGCAVSRLGERGTYVALPVTLFLCGAALARIDHAWIAAAFAGMALVRGLHNPLVDNSINRRIESRRRATVLSVRSVTKNALMATAWPIGGAVADTYGLQAVFLTFAVTSLVLGGGALALWVCAERADLPRRGPPEDLGSDIASSL
ncbi:MAG TPA: hypothetical protein DEP35_13500 [Deltaproteobacteria bacterium]|nr:hypothetical protein [Deltaproteobacteria bacterium]